MTPAPARAFFRDLRSIPNLITLSRIVLIVAAAALFFAGHPGIAVALAVIAGITDYLDGIVARATGQVTRLGEILDQFCDVFYESLVLLVAIVQFRFLPGFVMVVYLLRELWVMSIRRFAAEHRIEIPSSILGKLKANFVMWGFLPSYLSMLQVFPAAEPFLGIFGRVAIAVGIGFGYLSAWGYTRRFISGYDRVGGT